MFSNVYVDVAIGLVFIYLLYSLLVTAIQELISSFLNFRGKVLYRAIRQMLCDKGEDVLAQKFYNHPLLKKLNFHRHNKFPSYLNSETFAKITKDILPDLHLGKGKELSFDERLELLPEGELKAAIFTYMQDKTKPLDSILANWFDETMDRVTGLYKRIIQRNIFFVGLVVVIAFNVDSVSLFKKLSRDKKARETVVNQAIAFMEGNKDFDSILSKRRAIVLLDSIKVNDTANWKKIVESVLQQESDSLYKEYKEKQHVVDSLLKVDIAQLNNALGIGWQNFSLYDDKKNIYWFGILTMLLGWIITGLAITLGAPFWFDLLKKLIQIRGSGSRPDTMSEKKAKQNK
jgi:hypothetical protein